MAKTSQSISTYLSTNRNFTKWVIGSNRQLTQVAAGVIPFEHDPATGNRLGMLLEGSSQNLFPDSENLVSGVTSDNVSISSGVASFEKDGFIQRSSLSLNNKYIAVSFFLFSDVFPSIGYSSDPSVTCSIQFNGVDIIPAASDISIQGPMDDGYYRVRVRALNVHSSVSSVRIFRSQYHDSDFNVKKIQIERNQWSSYIPTTGSVQSRPAELITKTMVDGVDFNQNQGAIHLYTTPTPGTSGTCFTAFAGTDALEIATYTGMDTSFSIAKLNSLNTPESFYPRKFSWGLMNVTIASYSGYGARVYNSISNKVDKLKQYKFTNEIISIQFGDNDFFGIVHKFKWDAHALSDSDVASNVDQFTDTAFVFRTSSEAMMFMEENVPPTPEEILNNWPRMSNRLWIPDPSDATGQAADWFYDPVEDSFVQPNNTTQTEMILSPIKSSAFTFDVTLSSTASDDDMIGAVAAMDVFSGEPIFLAFTIHAGGLGGSRFAARYGDGTNSNNGVEITGNDIIASYRNADGGDGWSGKTIRIVIERSGDIVTARCSDWNSSSLIPGSLLTVDLNALPGNGSNLTASSRYGFLTQSQANSFYLDYSIRAEGIADANRVYAAQSNIRWINVAGEWVQAGTPIQDFSLSTQIDNPMTDEIFIPNSSGLQFQSTTGVEIKSGSIEVIPSGTPVTVSMASITSQFTSPYALQVDNVGLESGVSVNVVEGALQVTRINSSGYFYVTLSNGLSGDDYKAAYRRINVTS